MSSGEPLPPASVAAVDRPDSTAPPDTNTASASERPSPLPESGFEARSSATAEPSAPDEKPAAEHLAARGQTAEWERRAEWLEAEARAQIDPKARAHLLLAASEARALLGARDDARRLAVQAASQSSAPAFAARQARALQQAHGDFSATLKSLAEESRSAKTDAARAHAHYVAAEILRLIQRDPSGAEARLVTAEQSDPHDYRVTLQRLAGQLAQSPRPPDIYFRPDEAIKALRTAAGEIRQLRGSEAPRIDSDNINPALPLLEAQRALARGRLTEAAEAINQLRAYAELRPAVSWLTTLWRVATTARHEDALLAMRELAKSHPGRQERRALASRALRAGNGLVLNEALSDEASVEGARPAFSSIERLSLAALMAQPTDLTVVSERPAEDLALRPLTSAIERLDSLDAGSGGIAPTATLTLAPTPIEAEFTLGRTAASVKRFSDLDAGGDPGGAGIWSIVLQLERSREAKDLAQLAGELPRLSVNANAIAECSFISAVFAERAHGSAAAREHYQAAMFSATTREASVRALACEGRDSASMFRALSAHTSEPLRRSLLLTEALFRLEADAPEFDAVAEEAARTHPELPFAHQLGELSARMRGDRPRVARWLSRQRQRAEGAEDLIVATILEVLFLEQSDPALAADRLKDPEFADSNDLALQDLRERIEELDVPAKVRFRRRIAPELGQRGREHVLAEATLLCESAGDTRSAILAARELGGPLAELWMERLATEPSDLEWLSTTWSRLSQQTRDVDVACDLYNRLSRLEDQRGDRNQALTWQRARLKLRPGSLDALRFLELDSMAAGREAELERVAGELVQRLDEADGMGYAFLATRLKIDRGAFQEARSIVGRTAHCATPPLWALRLEVVYARDIGDDHTLLAIYRTLRERASQPLDKATLSLRASEAAARLGQTGLAKDEIQRARKLAPDNVMILSAQAEVLSSHADYADAAEAFEALASTTQSKAQKVEAFYQAGLLWLDTLGDRARGMLALQEAAAIDCPHAGLLARLLELHAQSEDFEGLRELIERQTARSIDRGPEAHVEIARAMALIQTGHLDEARAVLETLLERQPRHAEALNTSAELHFRMREWAAAEQAWRQIVDLAPRDRFQQSALYGLASLYEGELADPTRARATYDDILKLNPDDQAARQRLIVALASAGREEHAVTHQRELVRRARTDEERRQYLLELVELLGRIPGGVREAETLLEQAHRTWPESSLVLTAEIEHYRRAGDEGTARVIVERAANASRNALLAGRLEPALFRMLETASRLGDDADTAWAAQAALGALSGELIGITGAGHRAGQERFDDLLAPAQISAGFRRLLYGAGAAIERAYATDPRAFDPTPLGEPLASQVKSLAASFGLTDVRVVVSAKAGADCLCLPANPVYVVVGHRLVEHDDRRVLDFLLLRALKLAQANVCAISRMPPVEVWAALAGFLACFAPPWEATGQDAQRLVAARNKIRPHVTATLDLELTALTSAVSANIVPQAATMADAVWRWASRVAFLGVGELSTAVDSLWAAANIGPPAPKDIDSRIRWIANNNLARDLVGYGVSDAYIEARRRAGLSSTPL